MKNTYYKAIINIKLYKIIMIDIIKFNNDLVESKRNINIINYVKEVNILSYNIDIDFIDEFIELVNKDDCCIHHNLLQKYGILSLKEGTHHIKRIFEQYDFIENEDFKLANLGDFSRGGRGNKNEYYLHPRAFKICLMRSLKTKKYAKYYLLLEECIKYFNDYQNKLKEKYTIKLQEKIENKNIEISELQKQLKRLEDLVNKSNSKLDEALDKLDETNNILEDTTILNIITILFVVKRGILIKK